MKTRKKSTKVLILISTLLFANSVKSQTSKSINTFSEKSIYTLSEGTKIYAEMDNEINSKASSVNDTFTVTVSRPVVVREAAILPIGTVIEGRIISVKSAGIGKKNGSFEVIFESLKLPDGIKRKIQAELIDSEKLKSPQIINASANGGSTAIRALFGAFVDKSKGVISGAGTGLGIGASIILLRKGKEARIRSDEEILMVLKREVTLPPEDY